MSDQDQENEPMKVELKIPATLEPGGSGLTPEQAQRLADAVLDADLTAEETARIDADTALSGRIDGLDLGLDAAGVQALIDSALADNATDPEVAQAVSDLQAAIAAGDQADADALATAVANLAALIGAKADTSALAGLTDVQVDGSHVSEFGVDSTPVTADDIGAVPSGLIDQANGVAALNADRLVAPARLGSGTRDGTRLLRDDGAWVPAPSGGSSSVERNVDLGFPGAISPTGFITNLTNSFAPASGRLFLTRLVAPRAMAITLASVIVTSQGTDTVEVAVFSADLATRKATSGPVSGALSGANPFTAQIPLTVALAKDEVVYVGLLCIGGSTQLVATQLVQAQVADLFGSGVGQRIAMHQSGFSAMPTSVSIGSTSTDAGTPLIALRES